MAEEKKTGTPQSGTGPQGEEGTAPTKLIAGKYKTLEDAVEQGYTGLEQGFHALSERVGTLTRLLEAAVEAPQQQVPISQAGYNNANPYGRGFQDPRQQIEDDEIDPAQFITKPGRYLREREQQFEEKLVGRVRRVVEDVVTGSMVVADFKSRHPELVKHEPLVRTFMGQVDKRLPLKDQLESAAKLTKEYLATAGVLRNDPQRPPSGDDYVEGPRGGQPPRNPAPVPQDAGDEAELIDYIQQRQLQTAAHFGYDTGDNKK